MELLKIKKLKENAKVPSRGTQGSAGLDLCACIDEPITLNGGDTLDSLNDNIENVQYNEND